MREGDNPLLSGAVTGPQRNRPFKRFLKGQGFL